MKFWQNRPTLIIGGAGFGGGHLAEKLLQRGARVAVLDRLLPRDSYLHLSGLEAEIDFIPGDITKLDDLKLYFERYQFDTIFHVAAQPIVSISNTLPLETAQVNVIGTYNVLEACRSSRYARHMIFASSGAYYGATNSTCAIAEDAPALPAANIYAPTKVAADLAVRCYTKIYGMSTAVCRWMNTYGPGDTNFSRIVPATLRRLLRGETPLIDGTDGSNILELLHVRDMAAAYITVAERLSDPSTNKDVSGEAFNFGSGQPLTLLDAVRSITRAWNSITGDSIDEMPQITGPHIDSVKYLDISKAERLLDWHPAIDLENGLLETVQWYRAHRQIIGV